MRRALGAGLALVIAARAGRADPAAPQVDQAHVQREDAQRIDEQQRRVDPAAVARDPVPRGSLPDRSSARVTGLVLLGVAGTAAVLSVTIFGADAADPRTTHTTGNTIAALLGASAVISGIAGGAVLLTGRSRSRVQVAPAVTPQAMGLIATGQF